MLNIISLQDGRKGVLESETKQLIIPAEYNDITIQKYGIVARDSNNSCVIYHMDGTPAVKALTNALLLDNNLVLTASKKGVCYLVDYVQRQYICQLELDAILFFWGANKQADIYTADKDFSFLYRHPDYIRYGAHVENLVGVRSKATQKWGVYSVNTRSLYSPLEYEIVAQFTGTNTNVIAGVNDAGTLLQL